MSNSITVIAWHPYPTYEWLYKKPQMADFEPADGYALYDGGLTSKTLLLKDAASEGDEAAVKCKVSNPAGEFVYSDEVSISVGALEWTHNPDAVTVTISVPTPVEPVDTYEFDFDTYVETGDWNYTRSGSGEGIDGDDYHMRTVADNVPVYPYAAWDATNNKFYSNDDPPPIDPGPGPGPDPNPPPTEPPEDPGDDAPAAERIGYEARLPNPENPGERQPLPLWSHWFPGNKYGEDTCEPWWQIERINDHGDYILPVVEAGMIANANHIGPNFWSTLKAGQIPAHHREHQNELINPGMPKGTVNNTSWLVYPNNTIKYDGTNKQSYIDSDPSNLAAWGDENYSAYATAEGKGTFYQELNTHYNECDRVFVINNNEIKVIDWPDLSHSTIGSRNFQTLYPNGLSDDNAKLHLRERRNEQYALKKEASKDSVMAHKANLNTQPALPNLTKDGITMTGYFITTLNTAFSNGIWDQTHPLFSNADNGLSQGSLYLPNGWDGSNDQYFYLQHGNPSDGLSKTPDNDWAQHRNNGFMVSNAMPFLQYNLAANPQLWYEASCWTPPEKQRQYNETWNLPWDSDAYYAVVMSGMWVMKPRLLRHFETRNFFASSKGVPDVGVCIAALTALKAVWDTPKIAQHWRYGTTLLRADVDGVNIRPRYDSNTADAKARGLIDNTKRTWHLRNSTDPNIDPSRWLTGTNNLNTALQHLTIASEIGEVGTREWLIYSTSRINNTNVFTVYHQDFPGGQVDIATDRYGKYFLLQESDGSVTEVVKNV